MTKRLDGGSGEPVRNPDVDFGTVIAVRGLARVRGLDADPDCREIEDQHTLLPSDKPGSVADVVSSIAAAFDLGPGAAKIDTPTPEE